MKNTVSKIKFIRRKIKIHSRYVRIFFPHTKSFSVGVRKIYKKFFFKYRKYRNLRRRKRVVKYLKYTTFKRVYNFLFFISKVKKNNFSKFYPRLKFYRFGPFSVSFSKLYSTSVYFKDANLETLISGTEKPHFPENSSLIKTFSFYKIKRRHSRIKFYKRNLKRLAHRIVRKNKVFFKKRKQKIKKLRRTKYIIVKKHYNSLTSRRFVRFVRPGKFKAIKSAKGLKNILAVRVIKTYNNFFIALQTSLGQNVFSYSTGRVDLRRNRRLTKQALEIASRNFSSILRRRKFSRLNFTIVGRITYHSRIFIRILRSYKIKISAIRFILRRAHNGLRIRSSRRV
jgi:ribosomal protein S11